MRSVTIADRSREADTLSYTNEKWQGLDMHQGPTSEHATAFAARGTVRRVCEKGIVGGRPVFSLDCVNRVNLVRICEEGYLYHRAGRALLPLALHSLRTTQHAAKHAQDRI